MELTLNPPIVATFPWDAHLTAILNDGRRRKIKVDIWQLHSIDWLSGKGM